MRASLPALDATEGPQDAPKVLRGHENQDSRCPPDMSRAIDRCRPDASAGARLPTTSVSELSPRRLSALPLRHALENRNDAQCAPSARPGISTPFRECAQSPWVFIVKSGD